jgi:hypothetical protein
MAAKQIFDFITHESAVHLTYLEFGVKKFFP